MSERLEDIYRDGFVLRLSTGVVFDHLGRLYESSPDGDYVHVDFRRASIHVLSSNKTVTLIELTREAVIELADDLDYQVEFDGNAQYRRALRRLQEQVDLGSLKGGA